MDESSGTGKTGIGLTSTVLTTSVVPEALAETNHIAIPAGTVNRLLDIVELHFVDGGHGVG